MTNPLTSLTEADIRARCSETSFERGQNYYKGGAIIKRWRHGETGLAAHVAGTETYQVRVGAVLDEVRVTCTCPYDWGGDCKHIVATLLAWVNEPDSFQPPVDVRAILKKRTKAALIDLLLDIFSIYPNLVDDLDVVSRPDDQNLLEKVDDLFDKMAPWGDLSEAEVEAHLRLIARRADRLAEQGQTDLARRVYYAILSGCVGLFKNYSRSNFFSRDVPVVFAEAYDRLASEQVEERGAVIKAEVDALYKDLFDPEALGLEDALGETWLTLIEHNLVEGGGLQT